MKTSLPFKTNEPINGAIQMLGYQLMECKQGSPEWLQARAGLTTASTFADAVSTLSRASGDKKAGDPTDKAETLAASTALELIVGKPWGDVYQSWEMRRGSEEEWNAREAYMRKYDVDVTESGIAITADRQFGYSTDGEVERKGASSPLGGIEIKTPANALKLLRMLSSGDTAEYEHQMHGGMWVCNWDFIDYIMWIPEKHAVDNDGLYVKRIFRDEKFIDEMVKGLLRHREMVWRALCVFKTKMEILVNEGIKGVKFDGIEDVEAKVDTAIKAIENAAAPAPAAPQNIDPSIAKLFS